MGYRLRVAQIVCFLCVQVPLMAGGAQSAMFTFSNKCEFTVWPGLLSRGGLSPSPLPSTGFELATGESMTMPAPDGWSGRFWGRTLCSTDPSGKFRCATGDCGYGTVECSGKGAAHTATLADFTLDGGGGVDIYSVSLADGYNLPVLVAPRGGSVTGGGRSNCSVTGCVVDLNGVCPPQLMATAGGERVACRRACKAFGSPEYCCRGKYGSANT